MSWTINFSGLSGTSYKYWNVDLSRMADIAAVSGNYAFLKPTGINTWTPVYFGEAENLRDRLRTHDRWADAVRTGATVIVAHTTPNGAAGRLAEERDLIAKWNPALNVHHRTTG